MDQTRVPEDLAQALFITLLTDRLSIRQATAGFKAAQVPARLQLQSVTVEGYLAVAVLELPAAADQVEDSMAEGVDNSGSASNN